MLAGENDLLTVMPELAKEWDYERNGNLLPSQVTSKSGKKVWWRCKNGHSWKTEIYARERNGCPFCSGRMAEKGKNDIATIRPDLLAQWDYEKNTVKPDEILLQSNVAVWWKCANGHSWKTSPCNRYRGDACPKCLGRIYMKTHFIS